MKYNKFSKILLSVLGTSVVGASIFYYLYNNYFNKNGNSPYVFLTKEESELRFSLIKNISYKLYFRLNTSYSIGFKYIYIENENLYDGLVLITFDMVKIEEINLDFTGLVRLLSINGKVLNIVEQNMEKIRIESKYLLEHNIILIRFENRFSHTTHGFRYWADRNMNVITK